MPIELQKKKLIPFHFTDGLIGIFIMASYDPYITGKYNSLYTLKSPIGVVKKHLYIKVVSIIKRDIFFSALCYC